MGLAGDAGLALDAGFAAALAETTGGVALGAALSGRSDAGWVLPSGAGRSLAWQADARATKETMESRVTRECTTAD